MWFRAEFRKVAVVDDHHAVRASKARVRAAGDNYC